MNTIGTGNIISQYLNTSNNSSDELKVVVQEQIEKARHETKDLQNQIEKVKARKQDTNLLEMTASVPAITPGAINLKPVGILKGHTNKIADFRWSRDSKLILSASQDGFMIVWDSLTGLKRSAIPLDSQWVLTCALSPSGALAASAGLNNNCTIYRMPRGSAVQQNVTSIFKGHTGYISGVEFVSESRVVTSSGDMTCALWDIPKAKRVREYSDHLGDVLAISIPVTNLSKNNMFASCGSDGYTFIWDVRSPSAVQQFSIGSCDSNCLKFFPDGNSVAVGYDDGTISLFDLRADCTIALYSINDRGSPLQKENVFLNSNDYQSSSSSPKSPISLATNYFEDRGVISLDFSGSGRLMYSCYINLGCQVWDVLKGEVVYSLEGHGNRLAGVKCSPDGMAICTGSWDQTLKLWTPQYEKTKTH